MVSTNNHVLQSFEVFFWWQNKFFFLCWSVVTKLQTKKNDAFFRNIDLHSSKVSLQEICWFVAGICLIWKLMEHTNGHSPDAFIIPTLQNNF